MRKAAAPSAPDAAPRPWRLRYARRILDEDVDEMGHAALKLARNACEKKLAKDPVGYGAPLHHPLHGLFKMKSSHLRVAYHVETATHEVWVLLIGNRRDIWDRHQAEILDRLELERAWNQRAQEESRTRGAAETKRSGKPARRRGRSR